MQLVKRLSACGNSLAVTIDRPLLRLLGIGVETQLRVTTDGRRLIIEPLSPKADGEVVNPVEERGTLTVEERINVVRMFWTLVYQFQMSPQTFARLKPGEEAHIRAVLRFQVTLELGVEKLGDEDVAAVRRFWECFRVMRDHGRWEDAIRIALERVPL